MIVFLYIIYYKYLIKLQTKRPKKKMTTHVCFRHPSTEMKDIFCCDFPTSECCPTGCDIFISPFNASEKEYSSPSKLRSDVDMYRLMEVAFKQLPEVAKKNMVFLNDGNYGTTRGMESQSQKRFEKVSKKIFQ